jgi:hypothetical protein
VALRGRHREVIFRGVSKEEQNLPLPGVLLNNTADTHVGPGARGEPAKRGPPPQRRRVLAARAAAPASVRAAHHANQEPNHREARENCTGTAGPARPGPGGAPETAGTPEFVRLATRTVQNHEFWGRLPFCVELSFPIPRHNGLAESQHFESRSFWAPSRAWKAWKPDIDDLGRRRFLPRAFSCPSDSFSRSWSCQWSL